jgi:hypothetical protein
MFLNKKFVQLRIFTNFYKYKFRFRIKNCLDLYQDLKFFFSSIQLGSPHIFCTLFRVFYLLTSLIKAYLSVLHCVSIADLCTYIVHSCFCVFFYLSIFCTSDTAFFYEVLPGVLAFRPFSLGNLMFSAFFIMVKMTYMFLHFCKNPCLQK